MEIKTLTPCARCGVGPRHKKHSWCNPCINIYQASYRAANDHKQCTLCLINPRAKNLSWCAPCRNNRRKRYKYPHNPVISRKHRLSQKGKLSARKAHLKLVGTYQKRANHLINYAVKIGLLPKPSLYICIYCNISPAKVWEHRDYRAIFAVKPACLKCNSRLGLGAYSYEKCPKGYISKDYLEFNPRDFILIE